MHLMTERNEKGYSCVQCILSRSEAGRVSRAAAADQPAETAREETRQANTSAASSGSSDDNAL